MSHFKILTEALKTPIDLHLDVDLNLDIDLDHEHLDNFDLDPDHQVKVELGNQTLDAPSRLIRIKSYLLPLNVFGWWRSFVGGG